MGPPRYLRRLRPFPPPSPAVAPARRLCCEEEERVARRRRRRRSARAPAEFRPHRRQRRRVVSAPLLRRVSRALLEVAEIKGQQRLCYIPLHPQGGKGGGAKVHWATNTSASDSESIKERLAAGLLYGSYLLLNSCLHWYVVCPQDAIIVFDPVLELFRSMASPNVKDVTARLLEIDGTLGIGLVSKEGTAKLWVLQNYEMEVWSFKCQVEFPPVEMRSISGEGFYYGRVVSDHGEMFMYIKCASFLFMCDSKGKLLEKFRMGDMFPRVKGHFKESLVSHEFFRRQDGARARQPHFLCGP